MRDWKALQVGLPRPREEPRPESAQTLPSPAPPPPPHGLTCTQSNYYPLVRALAPRPSPEAALPEGGLVAPAGHVVEPGPHHLPRQRDVLGGTHGMSTAQLPADHRCFCQRPLLVAHVSPLLLVPDQHHPVARAVSVPQPQVMRSAYRGQASLRGDQNRLRGEEGERAPAGRYEDTCVCPGPLPRSCCEASVQSRGPHHPSTCSPER